MRGWIRAGLLLGGLALVPTMATAQRVTDRDINLRVGEQTTIDASGIANYSEGVSGIADVRVLPDGSEFVVVGLRPGSTSLLLIREDGRQVRYAIQVVAADADAPSGQGVVSEEPNIRLDLFFVELNETSDLRVGVGWPGVLGGAQNQVTGVVDLTAGGTLTSAILTFEQVIPRIDLLHSTGWGRIQRHVVLVTANGTEAEYNSGGRINIAIPGSLGTSELRSVNFGSRLAVVPRYDASSGRVEVQIDSEISDLIDTGQPLPGNTLTTARATANLQLGQALALGGLQAESERSGRTGLPGLSQIPIIGIFFGSHGSRSEQTQNVLLIVPSVMEPVQQSSRRLIGEALRIYSEAGNVADSRLLESAFSTPEDTPRGADAAD